MPGACWPGTGGGVFSKLERRGPRSRGGSCGSAIGTCGCGGCGRGAIGGGAIRAAVALPAPGGRRARGGRGRAAAAGRRRRAPAGRGLARRKESRALAPAPPPREASRARWAASDSTLRTASSSDSRSRVISDSLKRRIDAAQLLDQGGAGPLIKRTAALARSTRVEAGNSACDQRVVISHVLINAGVAVTSR